jgi:hypothetical protein
MAVTAPDITLPGSLAEAVRAEYRRVFRPPYETLLTVAVNGALMSSAWFFLPTDLTNEIFKLHGTLAFALVLAGWMYSDVPATNLLGADALRVRAAIDEPALLRWLLASKNIVLWSVVTPLCMVIAWVNGYRAHDLLAALYTAIWIGVVPFGMLALSAWVGIVFPYHPIPVRYRWQNRRRWWSLLVRWGILVVTPYGIVPALAVIIMAPSLLLWGLLTPTGLAHKLPDRDLGWGVAVAVVMAVAATVLGHWGSLRLIRRRRDRLVDFLSDPTRG